MVENDTLDYVLFFCAVGGIDISNTMSNDDDAKEAEHITCTDKMKNLNINKCTEEVEVCANCGKEGSDLNICNKCKSIKYCNAACKKKHRSKHKKSARGV